VFARQLRAQLGKLLLQPGHLLLQGLHPALAPSLFPLAILVLRAR
jgi:hypothetical protein